MIRDYFNLGLKNLRRRRLRSWLTMVGIFVSIAIIFILISLSVGLENAVEEQFRLLGTDKFFITPSLEAGMPGANNPIQMTTDEVEVIERVSGVRYVAYMTIDNGKIEFKDKQRYHLVIGLPMDTSDAVKVLYESATMEADEGKLLQEGDRGVVMVGSDFKYANLFGRPVKTGNTIMINDVEFKVRGIVSPIGNPQDDRQVYIPLEDFKELFGSGDRVDSIIVQVQKGADVNEVAEKTEKKLLDFRDQDEKTQDFAVATPEEYLRAFKDILNIITVFLLGVATISLVVGAIGIANTMYTSVLERYREIGVMKAVGAKNSDVLMIFLVESGLLGMVGGIIGVAAGIGVSKLVEYVAVTQLRTNLLQAAMPLYLIIGCLLFAFLIGAVSGTLPAWRASQIRPVQALRYE